MNLKFIMPVYFALVIFINIPAAHAARWTLQSSIAQATSASPELKQSAAKIGARKADVELSGMWPDPSIELKVDNQVGLDDGSGDYALSEITLIQDIPLSRISNQQSVAHAQLSAAEHLKNNDALVLQNRVARVFYELQFASAVYKLAEKRVKLAEKFNRPADKNDQGSMVRYLTPLEKMRLGILSEKAYQFAATARRKLQSALTQFYKLLLIDTTSTVSVPRLQPVSIMPDTEALVRHQLNHPLLVGQQQNLRAATDQIDLARSSVLKDPSVSINRLRENFSGVTKSIYGIMLSIEIPIHDRKSTVVSKANYNASQQRIELGRLKRNLEINLNQSLTYFSRVVEQAGKYRKRVLEPAAKILELSEKGFVSGELNILSLIDANNTYYDSNQQYLDLILQSWLKLADINLYAGLFVNETKAQSGSKAAVGGRVK